jgi:transcriptional regulator with XRE-family HTH domain
MGNEMRFSDRIKFLRQQKNYSQEYIAGQLGMSTPGYNKIERGKTNPSWDRIRQIADILDVNPQELFGLTQHLAPTNHVPTEPPAHVENGFQQRIEALEREITLRDEIIFQLKKRLGEA